ncbi:MAG: glycosyltransferase family 4 protein [Gemmatimonadales bacterium]
MTPLRLVLAQNTPGHSWTGMGRWAHETAAALRGRGHTVSLWFSEDFPRRVTAGRLSVLRYPSALGRRLVRERASFDAAIIHEPAGRRYGRARRADPSLPPLLLMCHNLEAEVFATLRDAAALGFARVSLGQRLKTPLVRLPQSRDAIRLADHVLCLSQRDRRALVERWGLPGTRVTAFVNGAPAVVPRRPPSGPPTVLFVGGWLDVKGRRVLPPLWTLVSERMPGARLTLVGTGRSGPEVLSEFPPSVRGTVTVMQRVERVQAMADLFARHHVLVMPSLSEGSPLTLLEAMAAGVPVAAAAVGGIPDIVRHEATGILFPTCDSRAAGEAVLRLLTDRNLSEALANLAQREVQQHTWGGVAKAIEHAVAAVRT